MNIYDLKSQFVEFFLTPGKYMVFLFHCNSKTQTHKVNNLIPGILKARENCTGTEVIS